MTADDVLKKLKEISARHFKEDPEIGIDSLSLGLNIPPNQLVPLLMELKQQQHVILHRSTVTAAGSRSNGRIDDYVSVSLV